MDQPLYNPHGEIQAYRAYRDAVYLNSAVFLEELRRAMGTPAFLRFLNDYAGQMKQQVATSQDFFKILSRHTSQDLADLIHRYFNQIR